MSAVFSPDGQTMLTGSVDRTAMLWDTKMASPVAAFRGHDGPVWSVEFSRDGTRVLTWSGDHTARLWDASGAAIAVFRAGAVRIPAFSPDTRRVLVLFDRDIGVWNADTGVQVALLSVHGDTLAAAEFSPDASRVVTRADETEIWEVDTGARVAVLRGHTDAVTVAKFSPDGLHVITTSVDKTARVWNVASGAPEGPLEGHEDTLWGPIFSPDRLRMLTFSRDKTARLWDLPSSQRPNLGRPPESAKGTNFFPHAGALASRCRKAKTVSKGNYSPHFTCLSPGRLIPRPTQRAQSTKPQWANRHFSLACDSSPTHGADRLCWQ
jgi:WD40 repeat protein